jgi:hypothetical protein
MDRSNFGREEGDVSEQRRMEGGWEVAQGTWMNFLERSELIAAQIGGEDALGLLTLWTARKKPKNDDGYGDGGRNKKSHSNRPFYFMQIG